MNKINKHNNRITQRRIRNINYFKPVARLYFSDWLIENNFNNLDNNLKERKFNNFFAWFIGMKNNNNWRQYSEFKRSISDTRVIYIEDKFNLEKGLIDREDKELVKKTAWLTLVSLKAEIFNKQNKLNLCEKDVANLAFSVSRKIPEFSEPTDDDFFHFLKD